LNLLTNLGITPDTLLDLAKPLPDEVTQINNDFNFSHFLIDKPPKDVYQNTKEKLEQLIKDSSV